MPRRGENIYKRKDGRWEGRYLCSYDEIGNRKYKFIYVRTYSELREKLNNLKAAGQPAIGPTSGQLAYLYRLSASLSFQCLSRSLSVVSIVSLLYNHVADVPRLLGGGFHFRLSVGE